MPLLVIIAVALWFVFGDPPKDVANWFWRDAAAPWEEVDAFYYPNKNDLTRESVRRNVGSVDACRDWVFYEATKHNDTGLRRGDYECGVGRLEELGSITIYRTTVR